MAYLNSQFFCHSLVTHRNKNTGEIVTWTVKCTLLERSSAGRTLLSDMCLQPLWELSLFTTPWLNSTLPLLNKTHWLPLHWSFVNELLSSIFIMLNNYMILSQIKVSWGTSKVEIQRRKWNEGIDNWYSDEDQTVSHICLLLSLLMQFCFQQWTAEQVISRQQGQPSH